MQQFPEYVERMQELQKYALKVVTRKGVITFDFDTLYAKTDTETYESIKKISENPNLTDQQKVLLMNDTYKKYLDEVKDTIREDVKKDVKDANRVKIDSIVDMVAPSFIISGVDEKPIINRTRMIAGLNSKDYIYHSIENRGLQSIKQSGTPSSGYLTRQLKFLMNDFVYKIGEDTENKGIMLPRYRVEGRTAPNGKIYPKHNGKLDPKDLVPVRSIVSKSNYDSIVTSDLISTLYTDIEDGNPIGLSFSSGITQSITQGALSLKHGGHERVIDESGILRAPENCRLDTSNPNWLILRCRGGKELKYPRPSNFVENNKDKYQKGDIIGTAYRTTSPIYQLNALIKLMRAKGSDGSRYFEKDNVLVSDCYCLESGEIHYIIDSEGIMKVTIGGREYYYEDESMYYYPEGTFINKYQRFCSGVVDISKVAGELNDINDIYQIFRSQFYELSSKSFKKNGIVSEGDNREELVEMVFTSLTRVKSDGIGGVDANFLGVAKSIKGSDSFYTLLSYGEAGRVVRKALENKVELQGDIMTNTVLGILLNNHLDDNFYK